MTTIQQIVDEWKSRFGKDSDMEFVSIDKDKPEEVIDSGTSYEKREKWASIKLSKDTNIDGRKWFLGGYNTACYYFSEFANRIEVGIRIGKAIVTRSGAGEDIFKSMKEIEQSDANKYEWKANKTRYGTLRLISKITDPNKDKVFICDCMQELIEKMQQKKIKEKLEVVEKKIADQDAEYWYDKGYEFYSSEKFEEAIEQFKKGYDKNSNLDGNADTFIRWGNSLYELAKIKQDENLFNQAIDKYGEVIELKSKDPLYFISYGNMLYEFAKIKQDENLFNQAIDKYEEVIKLDSNCAYAFIKKGAALANLAKIKNNKNLYKKAVECSKNAKCNILSISDPFNKKDIKQLEIDIFYPLLDSDSEDGKFFQETVKNKDISSNKLDKYKEIYICSIFIMRQLRVDFKDERFVAYYTKKEVFNKMLSENTKFRLNAIRSSNDPTEGEVLLDYLFGKDSDRETINSNAEYKTFAACFSFNYDSLNQFRLYGKEKEQEGTGLSLVFCDKFFSKKLRMPTEQLSEEEADEDDDNEEENDSKSRGYDEDEKDKLTLFRCIYVDSDFSKKRVETIGQKEKYLFYQEANENENDEKIKENYKKYKEYIDSIVNSVDEKLKKLKAFIKDNELNDNESVIVIGQLLINLRYLTKHIAFKEEQECRIAEILDIKDKDKEFEEEQEYRIVKIFKEKKIEGEQEYEIMKIFNIKDKDRKIKEEDYKMYTEYKPNIFRCDMPKSSNRIEKIYFGPKVAAKDIEFLRDLLIKKGYGHIICEKSKNPLA